MTEIDYDKLCADPAYRAEVEAAHKAGLRIQKRRPSAEHLSRWFFDDRGPAWWWGSGWQYRIAPGQVWPIPTEQPERKAREWWLILSPANGVVGSVERMDRGHECAVHVREILPGELSREALEAGHAAQVRVLNAQISELEKLAYATDDEGERYDVFTLAQALNDTCLERDHLKAEVAELKRQLAEAQGERDAALIELGRKHLTWIGADFAKSESKAAFMVTTINQPESSPPKIAKNGVIPECGPLPQSVFDGAPDGVEWAVICPSGIALWSKSEPRKSEPSTGLVMWCGAFTMSEKHFSSLGWLESKTRRHRA